MIAIPQSPRPSRIEVFAWTAGLCALWVAVYFACNWISSLRTDVRTLQFEWERAIPFIPWLIVPYMSIDLFFVAAPFLCRTRHQMQVLIARLLSATAIAAFSFLAIPMTLAVERPSINGWLGGVYEMLKAGDQPHNMCPSLHVALLLLLWPVYHRAARGIVRVLLHVWFALILISVLPVFQHHFVDVIGGIIVAIICIIAFPETEHSPWFVAPDFGVRRQIARRYALAALPLIALGIAIGPWGFLPGWIGGSLLLVACIYLLGSPALFRKHNGQLPAGTRFVLAPYLIGLGVTRRHFARRGGPGWSNITVALIVGRRPSESEARTLADDGIVAVVDLTAEHRARTSFRSLSYLNLPVLDLTTPSLACCQVACAFIDEHAPRGRIYLHCGLGYSRSAMVAAAYLLHTREAADAEHACRLIEERHALARLSESDRVALRAVAETLRTCTANDSSNSGRVPSRPTPPSADG